MDKCRVARDRNENLLGYVVWLEALGCAEIQSVCVHPDHRRRGIGKALIDDLVDRVDGNILLYVSNKNADAMTLYLLCGFSILGRIPHYYGGADDALVMARAGTK
jgi:ribosomal-protein-alanine N-acetyltransferase